VRRLFSLSSLLKKKIYKKYFTFFFLLLLFSLLDFFQIFIQLPQSTYDGDVQRRKKKALSEKKNLKVKHSLYT